MKKWLFSLILLLPLIAYANPEVGNDGPIHFVLDTNNADHEYKTDSGKCIGGVYPAGNGTAWGEITCKSISWTLPWYTVPGVESEESIALSSNEMPGTPCELFDSSNNAGNNQGHNVTQFNSNDWRATYVATRTVTGAWSTVYHIRCDSGQQQ